MEIKKFKLFKENHDGGPQNYMFFGNLKTIKRLVDEMLEMDEAEVDAMLSNGHNWALDHIATSKDDVEEVFNFIAGHSDEYEEEHNEDKINVRCEISRQIAPPYLDSGCVIYTSITE